MVSLYGIDDQKACRMKQSEMESQRDQKEKHTIKVAAITGSIALVLLLVIVIGSFLESNTSYSGHADSDSYNFYYGPVLPLTLSEIGRAHV